MQDSNVRIVSFSASTEKILESRISEYNEKASAERQATLEMVKAVYRRGAQAFSNKNFNSNQDELAMKRVNAFLRLLSAGRPANINYTVDNDLLPLGHPMANHQGLTASIDNYTSELTVILKNYEDYASPEDAITSLAEFSGFGYEITPALRASWIRAVKNSDDPYSRAKNLAELGYASLDADLLPITEKGASS